MLMLALKTLSRNMTCTFVDKLQQLQLTIIILTSSCRTRLSGSHIDMGKCTENIVKLKENFVTQNYGPSESIFRTKGFILLFIFIFLYFTITLSQVIDFICNFLFCLLPLILISWNIVSVEFVG